MKKSLSWKSHKILEIAELNPVKRDSIAFRVKGLGLRVQG